MNKYVHSLTSRNMEEETGAEGLLGNRGSLRSSWKLGIIFRSNNHLLKDSLGASMPAKGEGWRVKGEVGRGGGGLKERWGRVEGGELIEW